MTNDACLLAGIWCLNWIHSFSLPHGPKSPCRAIEPSYWPHISGTEKVPSHGSHNHDDQKIQSFSSLSRSTYDGMCSLTCKSSGYQRSDTILFFQNSPIGRQLLSTISDNLHLLIHACSLWNYDKIHQPSLWFTKNPSSLVENQPRVFPSLSLGNPATSIFPIISIFRLKLHPPPLLQAWRSVSLHLRTSS